MAPSKLESWHATNLPAARPIRPDLWLLDQQVAYLDHGAYGAVPKPVLEAQRSAAEAVERNPERFYRTELVPQLAEVRKGVADFLQTDAAGLVLVQNATEAVQVALDAVQLEPLAEVVYTDHSYPWVEAAIARMCADRGAVPRSVALPDPEELTEAEFAAALIASLKRVMNRRTALLVLDQITSASAIRLPVEAVCAELGEEVPILIDGAHAPGLIDAPVPSGAAFWFGNLHKWAFAARTAAALVVAPRWRTKVRPLVASFGESLGFPDSFTYLGTRNPSAYLALPAALAFPVDYLDMTFPQLRERNATVLQFGLELLTDALKVQMPHDDRLPMRSVPLGLSGGGGEAWELSGRLRQKGVAVGVSSIDQQLHVRPSVQAYVGVREFESLVTALKEEGLPR